MISVQADNLHDGKALEKEVDADLDAFNAWFQEHLKDGPLDNLERAAIKTYLWWKTHDGAKKEAPEGASSPA